MLEGAISVAQRAEYIGRIREITKVSCCNMD
jgi:glycyl-tRNA synthetase alpha subunit